MILYGNWLRLTLVTRQKIANNFGIGKTRPTHVVNMGSGVSEVADDGYEVKNIESQLNVKALQDYTGSTETDLNVLWGQMVDKIEGRNTFIPVPVELPPKVMTTFGEQYHTIAPKKEPNIEQIKAVHEALTPTPKKRGRPAKITK